MRQRQGQVANADTERREKMSDLNTYFLVLPLPFVASNSNNAALSEAILSNNSSTDFFDST
jgi:hypothetical protein